MLNFGLFLGYAILGFLFWYVYLRQKPIYRVKGNSWGDYPDMGDTFNDGVEPIETSTKQHEPIRIKQSRRNGWVIAEQEKQVLHEIKNVNLESTSTNPRLV
jgi:hypothetical protein